MLELTGAGAALLVGLVVGWLVGRRRRGDGRLFYLEWRAGSDEPVKSRPPGPVAGPAPPGPGDRGDTGGGD